MTGYTDYLIQSNLEFISELEQELDGFNDFEDFNESFSGIDDEINAHEFDDEWANELEPGYNFLQDEYDFVYPENDWDEPYEFEDFQEEFDVETERISDNERRILQLSGLNESDLLEAMLDAEHQNFDEYDEIDDISQHRGKPGMKLNRKSYGGRYGKYAKKFGEKSVKHAKKAQNATNKVSKTYHKVAARINKAKQSAYADHGKKDYRPGYRSAKYVKTLTTGRY